MLPSRTVTLLFTDIEGWTRLWEEHPEAMRTARAWHDEILRKTIGAYSGWCSPPAGTVLELRSAWPPMRSRR